MRKTNAEKRVKEEGKGESGECRRTEEKENNAPWSIDRATATGRLEDAADDGVGEHGRVKVHEEALTHAG